jgi:CheY-like chemotaxis protein
MTKKILIVDDDLDTVKLIGLMLERHGYEISAAQTGVQGLAKAQTENPDLVILDIMMPDLDGYDVCRRLRADPATAGMPIIMFTAKALVDDKVAGFQAGADDYLTKPVHSDELASRVEAVLLRATQRQGRAQLSLRAKVIGFVGSKGGAGTTTLAVNIAVSLARGPAKGKRVVLADMRSGMASTAFALGLAGRGGIARLLEQPVEQIDSRMVEAQLEEHTSGLLVLEGQIEPPGVAMPISVPHAETIIKHLGNVADYLLLDLGVGLGEVNSRVLAICDHVVVAVEPNRVSLMLAQALLGEMNTSLSLAKHRISTVLVNKAPSAASYAKPTIEGLLQHDLVGVITPVPEHAFQSLEKGVPMVMLQAATLAAQQFQAIAEHLAGV